MPTAAENDCASLVSKGVPDWVRPGRLPLAGIVRVAHGAGISAALVFGLLFALAKASALAGVLADHFWNQRAFAMIVQGGLPEDQAKIGVTQFYTYLLTLGCVAAATALGALALRAASRVDRFIARRKKRPGKRTVVLLADAALVVAALAFSFATSPFVGALAVSAIVLSALSLAPYLGRRLPVLPAADGRTRAGIVIGAEALCLGWTVWFMFSTQLGSGLVVVALAVVAFAAARIARAPASGSRSLTEDALAGVPLLFLPFVGLRREPSPWWLVAALAAVLVARVIGARSERRRSLPDWFVSVLAPGAVIAILFLPLRFRDLDHASHAGHEGQHLGWLESVLHGRLLWADAGFVYGALREYLLGALAWGTGGMTLDHVRLAHVLLNVAGVAALTWMGWRFVHRRFWPFVLFGWLVVVQTPLAFFLNYPSEICFGWADVARPAFAMLAIYLSLAASARLSPTGRWSPKGAAPIVLAGALLGATVLYSPDTGVAGVAATAGALALDALLRRGKEGFRARAFWSARAIAALGVGVAVVLGGFIAVYAALGRGHELRQYAEYMSFLGAGVTGASAAPIAREDFLGPAFFGEGRLQYFIPIFATCVGVAVLVASALGRTWTRRTTLLAALVLFSIAFCRYGLWRADPWHMIMAAVPAYLVLASIVADATAAAPFLPVGRARPLSFAAVVSCLVLLFAGTRLGPSQGIAARLSHLETPSVGQPYVHADVAHAGDTRIDEPTLQIAKYVRENTSADDPIWVTYHYITGGEIYFLADRVDATPFDTWLEVISTTDAARIMAALEATPPVLIVGDIYGYTKEIASYVDAHWKVVETLTDWSINIRRFDPTSFPAKDPHAQRISTAAR